MFVVVDGGGFLGSTHDRVQVPVVGAGPVHPTAVGAAGEGVVGGAGSCLDKVGDLCGGCGPEQAVAGRAACPGVQGWGEAVQDLVQLGVGVVGVYVGPGVQVAPVQQAAVAGEQDALFGVCLLEQGEVVAVVVVDGVQAQ